MSGKIKISLDDIFLSNQTFGRGETGGKMKHRSRAHRSAYKPTRNESGSSRNQVSKNYDNNSSSSGNVMYSANSKNAKLIVSNLAVTVDEADIRQLFEDIGHLIMVSMQCDRSGRSLGTVEVLFERRTDALRAIKQYNDVPLDGLPMKIELETTEPPTLSHQTEHYHRGAVNKMRGPRSYKKTDKDGHFNGKSAARHSYRQSSRGQQKIYTKKRSEMTAEDLDEELDNYIQGGKDSSKPKLGVQDTKS